MTPSGKKLMIVVSAIVVAVIVIVPSVYVLHNRPVEITVSHGTNSYTWIGDFFNVDSLHSMVLYNYSTSTVIKVKGGGTSYLNASLNGFAWGLGLVGGVFNFGLSMRVTGNLSSDLKPTGLTFTVNPVPGSNSVFSSYLHQNVTQGLGLHTPYGVFYPVNVSLEGVYGLNMSAKLHNDTGLKHSQRYHFSTIDEVEGDTLSDSESSGLHYNTTYGMAITTNLTGLSKPVSTTLYLFFIVVPKG